jgi:hypothetical protein
MAEPTLSQVSVVSLLYCASVEFSHFEQKVVLGAYCLRNCAFSVKVLQIVKKYISISAGGVTPPVLPCLHGMYQGKFTPHSDIQMIDLHEDLRPFTSDNTQSLGELLHDFLRYYVEFE